MIHQSHRRFMAVYCTTRQMGDCPFGVLWRETLLVLFSIVLTPENFMVIRLATAEDRVVYDFSTLQLRQVLLCINARGLHALRYLLLAEARTTL